MTDTIRVIIDTDPGVDDFLAIALALQSPELIVEALTTTGGNAALRHTNANARRILAALGRPDIPVYRGAQRPLVGSFGDAEDVHGAGGLPIRLPAPRVPQSGVRAADYLADRLRTGPPATLIALGPLTNLARLFRDAPDTVDRVIRIFVMGGALDVPGNVTPFAEFNIWSDPDAADAVFGSGAHITMVGSDVCGQVRVLADETERGATPAIRALVDTQLAVRGELGITLYDPLTVMAAACPAVVTTRRMRIAVDTTTGPERGRTRREPGGHENGHEIDVAMEVDVDAALALFQRRVLSSSFPS